MTTPVFRIRTREQGGSLVGASVVRDGATIGAATSYTRRAAVRDAVAKARATMARERKPPVVTLLSSNGCQLRFRVSGRPAAGAWRRDYREYVARKNAENRCPEPPACELTIWRRMPRERLTAGVRLGSYGGTVWPSAWPCLFVPDPVNTAQCPSAPMLTELGAAVLEAAIAAASSERSA